MAKRNLATLQRPRPPEQLLAGGKRFAAAPELLSWLREAFIIGDGPLVNPDHAHLRFAHLGCLWTNIPNSRHMNAIAGTCEAPMKKGGWPGEREQFQLRNWFGSLPNFLLTFDALYANECGDIEFCALVEHELYHCAQKRDKFGGLMFGKGGKPVYAIRGHDVEEHLGIVRRYGAGAAAGKTAELVRLAGQKPQIAEVDIAGICGTCSAKR